jgi:multiple sugar transport system permease protein/putative aldouronate transport system permease protein
MKNFMRTVPYEIIESGKVDGAGDFRIFAQLCLPMMKPALATIGLFLALGYWNEWYLSSLYLGSTVEFKPLQYHLYNIINTANALRNSVAGSNVSVTDLPSNTLKMASAIVAIGPILLLYPFIQKYFVSGITIGAVKG